MDIENSEKSGRHEGGLVLYLALLRLGGLVLYLALLRLGGLVLYLA
jgi:hypothetical protein